MLDSVKGKYRNYELRANVAASTNKVSSTVVKAVLFRVTSVLLLLGSAVLLNIALIFEPWKREFEGHAPQVTFEYSVWDVCRTAPPGWRCIEGGLEDAATWFLVFRWLLIIGSAQQYIAAIYCILMIAFRGNKQSKHFWIPAFISLSSGALILTAMVLFSAYHQFDFLEPKRMELMGWRDDQQVATENAWPAYAGYASIGTAVLGFFYLMAAFFADERFRENYDAIRFKKNLVGY